MPSRLKQTSLLALITSLLLLATHVDVARQVGTPPRASKVRQANVPEATTRHGAGVGTSLQGATAAQQSAEIVGASESDAESAYAEGEKLRALWRAESFSAAIEKYNVARRYWNTSGNNLKEAKALSAIGGIYLTLSEYKKSLLSYKDALSASHAAGDRRAEVEALNAISSIYQYLGDMPRAESYSRRAHGLSRKIGDTRGEAGALNGIGEAYYFSGNMEMALDSFRRAESLWQTDDAVRAQTLLDIGYAYFDLRNAQQARDYYKRSLRIWEAIGDQRWRALSLTAAGGAYFYLGEKQFALDYHGRAAQISRDIGDRNGEAVALNGLGYVYSNLSEHQQALNCYRRALELFQLLGNREYASHTAIFVGGELQSLGNYNEAVEFYKQALGRKLSYSLTRANVLQRIGALYGTMGEQREALDYFARSLKTYRAIGDKVGEAAVLNRIGDAYGAKDGGEAARRCYGSALSLSRTVKNREGEAVTLGNLARLERTLGNLPQARSSIEEALDIVESLRTKVLSHGLRSSYFASVHQFYEIHLDVLMQMHRQQPGAGLDKIGFYVSEMARARSLLEMLGEAHADISQGVAPELLERERELGHALDEKAERQRQLLSGKHKQQEAASLESEINQLTINYEAVQAEIKTQSPRYAALTQPRPSRLDEIQRTAIDDDTLTLEYALGDERSYLWAVTRTGMESYELPPRAEIENAAREVYKLLTAGAPAQDGRAELDAKAAEDQYWQRAAALSRMVLGPAASLLGKRRLLIVPDGALQYVPFAALPEPPGSPVPDGSLQLPATDAPAQSPLVFNHEVVNLPSASVLVILRGQRAARPPAPKTVAVLADPVFEREDPRIQLATDRRASVPGGEGVSGRLALSLRGAGEDATRGGLTRLPASREEADKIMQLTPAGEGMQMLGFEVNRARVMNPNLGEYRIIHFATHGILNTEHPGLSGLVLSQFDEQGRSQDGFLRLHDIYNLSLPVEVVVLSACDTGLGKDIRGEGLFGLTRGFMYAGASSVVASLWKVDDEATAEFMKFFYHGMLQEELSPAAALRKAQVAMLGKKRWRSPYYWSAFVLQGDYDVKVNTSSARARYLWAAAAAAALVLLAGLLYAVFRRLRRRHVTH